MFTSHYVLRGITVVLASVFFASSLSAETLLFDDFQDGAANDWRSFGGGEIELSHRQGNVLLQIAPNSTAVRMFSTIGYGEVTISITFAAENFAEEDYCIADVLLGRDESWIEVARVWQGQADGKSLYTLISQNPRLDNQESIRLRVRNTSHVYKGNCWVDNIIVTAEPLRYLERKDNLSDVTRQSFSLDALVSGEMSSLAQTAAYVPGPSAQPATHTFQGRLHIPSQVMDGFLPVYDRLAISERGGLQTNQFPTVSIDLIQSDGYLIPRNRGLQETDHPFWSVIVQPGRVWSQRGDQGYSRASLPIALIEAGESCTHHGLMTFLYHDDGRVSQLAFQVASETCAYHQVNMWGMLKGEYEPLMWDDLDVHITSFKEEQASQLPVKPFQDLSEKFPNVKADMFEAKSKDGADRLSVAGLVVDGVHYRYGCMTRAGPYPYCSQLALPSDALAHTFVGGFGYLMLAQRYPELPEISLVDYLPACAAVHGWEDVTVAHALNMTTGHFGSRVPGADEVSANMLRFILMDSYFGKQRLACSHFYLQANPGYVWVYQSSASFLLGAVLNAYYQKHEGVDADLYRDLVVSDLWQPLGLSPLLYTSMRTADVTAQAHTYNGLWLTSDDAAQLGHWLLLEADVIRDDPLFEDASYQAAMQRYPEDRGVAVGQAFRAVKDSYRYKNGFYARDVAPLLGCKTETWVPFLSSRSGSVLMLFPNGIASYLFSDTDNLSTDSLIQSIHDMRPLCEEETYRQTSIMK